MKVLIACEESQEVCKAFRELGHEAFSCDILPCSGGHPEWHIQDDVLKHLDDGWDLMIAHPPCTHLAVSGARWFKDKKQEQEEAVEFFRKLLMSDILYTCIENPVGIISTKIRKPDQIIQPWQFGEPYQKTTCLWLKNLPKLNSTKIVDKGKFIIYKSGKKMPEWYAKLYGKGKERSKTFPGIAKAMAEQWGFEKKRLDYKRSCDECGKQARCWTWEIETWDGDIEPVFCCDKCYKFSTGEQK